MTIRRRLAFSFATILVLFCLNLGVYLWSKSRQGSAVMALQRAVSRQLLVASVSQSLNNLQKQITLLNGIIVEAVQAGADPQDVAQFESRLQTIDRQIEELERLSESTDRARIESLRKDYRELNSSWDIFYKNFGVNQSKAIVELATREIGRASCRERVYVLV